ncbi:MAG: hypothetical protein CVU38_11250 [Chloroflexi bacterium HGW-Chloroflexi-1]|nr:MAG: hypothetical protein CVU38_11250 [Chloroflexi bacterium HGW-Chloroflexi-1]
MTENLSVMNNPGPPWLSLLQRPYDSIFGPRNIWDLRMADGTAVRIERGSQGLNNNLYRVRFDGGVYTCKLFVVDERQRAQREWTAVRSLHDAGSRLAPEPVAYAPNGPLPQPVIVYQGVTGQSLSGQSLLADDLAALIECVGQIHRTAPAADTEPLVAWRQPEDYASYLAEIQEFLRALREWVTSGQVGAADLPNWAADLPALLPLIEAAMESAECAVASAGDRGACPAPALVRVDGNLDSIVRDEDGRLLFLDWESSGWGDPAFDLAELCWCPRAQTISQVQWQAALEAYVPHPRDETFWERLVVYNQLLPAWWVGRSAVHLLEGARQAVGQQRLVSIPTRLYRSVRTQLDNYLVALGTMAPAEDASAGE